MTAADAAARHAQRADFQLIAYTEVGLPHWRVRTRCELLARSQISPIDAAVLAAIGIGVDGRGDLMLMLGLDEVVLDGTVGAMLAEDWVRLSDSEQVALTEKGAGIAGAASQEQSEERMISFEFDGLLRRPGLLELPLEPSQLAALGAREIPPFPASRPDELELRDHKGEIEQLIRSYSSRRDREIDLLAIKEIVRRERVFCQATALLFRALQGSELRVAFVLDEQLSERHENAFAQARLLDRVGLARGVRSRTRHRALVDERALELYDGEREAELRRRIRQHQQALEVSTDSNREAASALREARLALAELPVRTLECYEHPGVLEISLRSAEHELTIVTPRLTDAVVDEDLLGEMRRALRRGVRIRLGHGTGRDPHEGIGAGARERLARLSSDYRKLEVAHIGAVKQGVLVRDDRWTVVTSFPLLAHRGDATRALGDERGWLLRAPELTTGVRDDLDTRWGRASRTFGRSAAQAQGRAGQRSQQRRRGKRR